MTAYTTLFPAQHGPALQSPGIARRPTTAARPGYQPDFASLLRRFEAISLSEMSAVARKTVWTPSSSCAKRNSTTPWRR